MGMNSFLNANSAKRFSASNTRPCRRPQKTKLENKLRKYCNYQDHFKLCLQICECEKL